ncbi:hypothetical protein DRO29_06910 [Candidatus Bathyarchaeota archaeon]|nr:MAG: hypothetical protein DRQ18_04220 [bacterium]RLG94118.1 MAG: hypothetical protein DRO29_06910 [Candidatus Bathyarchaeota archaeon]
MILYVFLCLPFVKPTDTQKEIENLLAPLLQMQTEKKTIAVLEPVGIHGEQTALGEFLREEMVSVLGKEGKFQVVERELLSKVMEEQKLFLTGAVSESSAVEIGKLTGADYILTGTITPFENSFRLNLRLVEVESGRIVKTISGDISKNDDLCKLWKEVKEPPDTPERIYREAIEYLKKGNRNKGWELLRRALAKYPTFRKESPEFLFFAGEYLFYHHQRAKGIELLQMVIRKFPQSPYARRAREILKLNRPGRKPRMK